MRKEFSGIIDSHGWVSKNFRVICTDPFSPDMQALTRTMKVLFENPEHQKKNPQAKAEMLMDTGFTAQAFLTPQKNSDVREVDWDSQDEGEDNYLNIRAALLASEDGGYLIRPVHWHGTGKALQIIGGELRDALDYRVQHALVHVGELTGPWELVYREELEKEREGRKSSTIQKSGTG